MTRLHDQPDWYCDQVLSGQVAVDVVAEDEYSLAFRRPISATGRDRVIVIPRAHVRSLLELDLHEAMPLLRMVQEMARLLTGLHDGCQVVTNCGDSQHNRHLHWHVIAGRGVADV
jgi:histidine triad (HIT) family protein